MKKALIITYYWPPSGGAGVQRWLKFVKYFRDFGWEPVVYIPENPEYPEIDYSLERDVPHGVKILRLPIREPYSAYKRFLGRKKEDRINAAFLSENKKNRFLEYISVWVRGNFFIPDARMLWIRPSVKFLAGYLRKNDIDAVISTGPPHSMHLIAMKLAARFGLPWLADFRDPWTNIDFYKDLHLTLPADRRHRTLERQVLKKAAAVVAISDTMAAGFSNIVPRNYHVITNGFDPDDGRYEKATIPDRQFSIAHIGTMVSTRNPVTLWEALRQLITENQGFRDDLVVRLVGKCDHSVTGSIRSYGLESFVKRTDYLPHDEVVRFQQQAQVLLLIINNTPNSKMILTGKFFEYLAAGRPILCLGPPEGDAARIIRETGSGVVTGFGDIASMKESIMGLYRYYKAGIPRQPALGIQRFSRKELTGRLTSILDQLISA